MAAQTKATTRKTPGKAKPRAVRGSVKPVKPSPPPVETADLTEEQEMAELKPTLIESLSPRRQMFVEWYLQTWNASEAARRSGYTGDPAVAGSRLLINDNIQEQIKARIAEVAMGADEVLLRLRDHARGNLKPFLTSEGFIDISTDTAMENIGLIKKIEVEKRVGGPEEDPWTETKTKIELHDPQAALVHLGRHHKLFTDKAEVSGPGGASPVVVQFIPYAGPDTDNS